MTEPKTVKIDDEEFSVDTLTERGIQLIKNIGRLDEVLSRQHLDVAITELAKSKLLDDLANEKVNFKES